MLTTLGLIAKGFSTRLVALCLFAGLPTFALGQTSDRLSSTSSDSTAKALAMDNALSVMTSGVWKIDGEYKGPRSQYYKLTGYLAYVAATERSDDDGDAGVLAMYLEPMAGGTATWISARLSCAFEKVGNGVRCIAVEGATQLLDLNFRFKTIPFRGKTAEAEILEPEDKSLDKRWTGRSTARGKFTIAKP